MVRFLPCTTAPLRDFPANILLFFRVDWGSQSLKKAPPAKQQRLDYAGGLSPSTPREISHEKSRSRFFSLAILKFQFAVRKKSAPMHITSTGAQRLDPGGLLSQSFTCNMTGPGSLPAFRVEYPPHGTAQSLSSALQRVKSAPGQNHFSSGRAFTRCTGLLLGWCMMRLNFFTCSVETVSGCFITYQRTPSEQGGVVSDPLKR